MFFGKKPARPSGREFMHHALGAMPLPPIPTKTNWRASLPPGAWDPLGNLDAGCCVWAGMLHYAQLITAVTGIKYVPQPAEALGLYSKFTGYVPGKPETDQGTDCVDALNDWSQLGWPLTDQTLNVGEAAELNYRSADMIRTSIALTGGAFFGATLPESALQTTNPWVVDDSPSTGEGHFVTAVDFDSEFVYVVTWGVVVPVSYDWLAANCDQAFAPFSPLWLLPSGKTPAGMSRDDYQAVISRLAA